MKQKKSIKEETEEKLGFKVPSEMFNNAVACAKRKQNNIYAREQRAEVLSPQYFLKLVEEYVRLLELEEITVSINKELNR